MDTNKMNTKKTIKFKIKPTHIMSLGWFLATIAFAYDSYFTYGLADSICFFGVSLIFYGFIFAMVRDFTS